MKVARPALITAGVAALATIVIRVADGLLDSRPLAGITISAVVIDLLVTRAGGDVSRSGTLLQRVRRGAIWTLPGLLAVAVVVLVATILRHATVAGATFDAASIGLGLLHALGSVARRQLAYLVLPLALLGTKLDPRFLVLFAALAAGAAGIPSGDSALSVFVGFGAALLGGAVLLRTRDFVASMMAEATVFFAINTVCTSLLDVRLGAWSLAPVERMQGPYAAALGLLLVTLAIAGLRSIPPGGTANAEASS